MPVSRDAKHEKEDNRLTAAGCYNTDADFALQVRMIVSIAFLPVNQIDVTLYVLNDTQTRLDTKLQPIIDWQVDSYIRQLKIETGRDVIQYFHCECETSLIEPSTSRIE